MAYYPTKDSGRDIASFDAVRLSVASEDDVLNWSYGEVLKPETINYRTQKPERDGLFCERIFGPTKDINPNDNKHRGIRSREAAVDKNGELVTKAAARRERMGHIKLSTPVAHIWFMRNTPSPLSLLLGLTNKQLERVAYFASYVILEVDEEKRDQLLADNEAEYEAGKTAIKMRYEKAAGDKDVDVTKLSEQMSKELDDITEKYDEVKTILGGFIKGSLLTENEYFNLPEGYEDLLKVGMGGEALYKMLEEVNLEELIMELAEDAESRKGQSKKKVQKRLKILEGMNSAGISPLSMCMTIVPVIPPDLRPMVQLSGDRFATSDLNDLYRRVINRNNRLKKLAELNAPEVIQRNEKRMLQEAVDALLDNSMVRGNRVANSTNNRRRLKSLSDLLKGKQGRFRQNLLGKRVDYSGRSVIVPGPELKIEQCGLPKKMTMELFRPFVVSKLLEWEQAHNIKSAQRLIDAGDAIVWDALDEAIRGKYVLLNRAPTLHRLGIQAFQPKLIEGSAIQLHPLVTTGFNADFDGDQMAVHLPLSAEAQAEARDLMSATNNLLKPSDGAPVLSISQDIILGAYYLTYEKPSVQTDQPKIFASIGEAQMAKDGGIIKYQTPIKTKVGDEIVITTLGRLKFNEVLPNDFPFVNQTMGKKVLNKVMARIFADYGANVTAKVADDVKELTLEHATRSAVSTGMHDYFDIDGLDHIVKEGEVRVAKISEQAEMGNMTEYERYRRTVDTWMKVDDDVKDLLQEQLQKTDTAISIMTNSGARGSLSNIKWATGMIGVTVDAFGHESEVPVKNSFKRGLTPLESFLYTRSTRKGSIDTALKTADSGYLTRRLVDVAQDVFTVDDVPGDDPGFMIGRDETAETMIEFGDRLYGRYTAEPIIDGNGQELIGDHDLITREIADKIQNDESIEAVKIMSILSTKQLHGIPQRSYGIDMATGYLVAEHEPVGVIAAQSVGEPGTQLTLKTFHSGGEAGGGGDITQGLPRVEELLEARKPKGEATLSEISGTLKITEDKESKKFTVKVTPSKAAEERVKIGEYEVVVEHGAEVLAGDVLAQAKGKAPLVAPFDGKVKVLKNDIVVKSLDKANPVDYEISESKMLRDKLGKFILHDGEEITSGDRLSIGSIDPHKLMELRGVEATQRYIINDVLRIYAAQGQNIADKHLEIIVRQMFSRVQIEESGDSPFVAGDIMSRAQVVDENEKLIAGGNKPAVYTQLLLGITKVSIYSDSFLSAASFQDTTRVLIGAAISGKVDHLKGLKENVIIGRKIPVGTGILSEEDFYESEFQGDSIDEFPEAQI
ncbi:MAG: DNA-directed RNA polymerase subunit beta' [Candidatus Nomurabacteria bacterium]|jgi:DNA-directed RNA polymerase subunit beta'|nr:DNA-directed RNA polymerase subunit beta' [Candidatus Nomurabacteria bacterium]